jgi:hypothetical protein
MSQLMSQLTSYVDANRIPFVVVGIGMWALPLVALYLRLRSRRTAAGPHGSGSLMPHQAGELIPEAMRLAARLMPAASGQRWLAEAESFLFEATPEQRAEAIRDYLSTAPRMIGASWLSHLANRTRTTISGRSASSRPDTEDHANH